jgi:PhnB protein
MKAAQSKERTTDEAQLRAIVEDYGEGLRTKDVERCVSHYTDDVVQFNLAPPLEFRGKETVKKNLGEWFNTFSGPIEFDTEKLELSTGTDTAFAYCFNRIGGTKKTGPSKEHWVRVTIGFQKTDGQWLVNHEHVSVPFYMDGSFRAAVDLKP